jgi:hypothetical protein
LAGVTIDGVTVAMIGATAERTAAMIGATGGTTGTTAALDPDCSGDSSRPGRAQTESHDQLTPQCLRDPKLMTNRTLLKQQLAPGDATGRKLQS